MFFSMKRLIIISNFHVVVILNTHVYYISNNKKNYEFIIKHAISYEFSKKILNVCVLTNNVAYCIEIMNMIWKTRKMWKIWKHSMRLWIILQHESSIFFLLKNVYYDAKLISINHLTFSKNEQKRKALHSIKLYQTTNDVWKYYNFYEHIEI